jgi:hypothetical protein
MSGMFMHSSRQPGGEYLHIRENFHVHLARSKAGEPGRDPGPVGVPGHGQVHILTFSCLNKFIRWV